MSTKKITSLLILQGWTMLWVVIGHAPLSSPTTSDVVNNASHSIANMLFNFAYSFHMPLFIMISGYLFFMTRVSKGWKWLDMAKDKFMRLGIPYIIFITLALAMKLLFPGEVDRQTELDAHGLLVNYLQPFNGALREMWFVAVILIYFLCYPIYGYLLRNKTTASVSLVVAGGMFLVPSTLITQWFALNMAVHFFIYFFIGMIIKRFELERYLSNWPFITGCAVIYTISYMLGWPFFPALTASLAFWGLAIIVDRALTSNLFSSFRDYTYQIFLIGIFAQIFAKILARKFEFNGSYPVWWLVCVLLGVYVPVLISKIPAVKNNKFLRRALGL